MAGGGGTRIPAFSVNEGRLKVQITVGRLHILGSYPRLLSHNPVLLNRQIVYISLNVNKDITLLGSIYKTVPLFHLTICLYFKCEIRRTFLRLAMKNGTRYWIWTNGLQVVIWETISVL